MSEQHLKTQPVIVCAAIKVGDTILAGARHFDPVMISQMKKIGRDDFHVAAGYQGFIDQFGNFHNRKRAMEIVKESGQPFNIERNGGDIVLFSEGIY